MTLVALVLTVFINSNVVATEQVFTFGIVPQQSASKLARLWGPIFEHISNETGLKIRFTTAPDIPEFEKRLASGEYDLAYMNPYHYTVFSKKPGYKAFSKARDKSIKGIIVVSKDSNIISLKQLNNIPIAFPAPASFAATILTQSGLVKNNIQFTPKYVSSHDSVYRTVARGIFLAGGGVVRTFKNMDPEIRHQLNILWTSEGFTPHALAAHPRLTQSTVLKIQRALINMDKSVMGMMLLNTIRIEGFESAKDNDWDDVRALKIHRQVKQ